MSNANPMPEAASAVSPQTLERLNYLDSWIGRRIEEAEAADARLEKRLSHVTKAEQAIRDLSESLRAQVAEACPILQQLTELRANVREAVEGVMADARSQFGQAADMVRSRLQLLGEAQQSFKGQAEGFEQAFAKLIADAEVHSRRVLEMLPGELARRLEGFERKVAGAVTAAEESVRQRTAGFDGWMDDKLAAAEVRVEQQVEESLRGSLAAAAQRAGQLAGPALHDLEKQAERAEARVAHLVDTARQNASAQLEGFEKTLADLNGDFLRQLSKLAADAQRQAIGGFGQMKQSIRQHGESAVADLRRVAGDLSGEVSQQAQSSQAQLAETAASAKRVLSQSANQFIAAADAVVEAAEQRLSTRLRDLRPRVSAAAEDADKALTLRLQRLLDGARAMVELHESQLAGRIESIRPRASNAARLAETELTAHLSRLEQEALTLTTSLEQRLANRIHELSRRSRQILRTELTSLDSIDTEALKHELQSALQPERENSVSVDLYLDQEKPAKVA